MITLTGIVENGVNHFSTRMNKYPEIFKNATGETLIPGTLNINVKRKVKINEHFRIKGSEINEPEQDLLFEVCKINGFWAYRIRPYNLLSGKGGHGDHIIEITSSKEFPNVDQGKMVELSFFR